LSARAHALFSMLRPAVQPARRRRCRRSAERRPWNRSSRLTLAVRALECRTFSTATHASAPLVGGQRVTVRGQSFSLRATARGGSASHCCGRNANSRIHAKLLLFRCTLTCCVRAAGSVVFFCRRPPAPDGRPARCPSVRATINRMHGQPAP